MVFKSLRTVAKKEWTQSIDTQSKTPHTTWMPASPTCKTHLAWSQASPPATWPGSWPETRTRTTLRLGRALWWTRTGWPWKLWTGFRMWPGLEQSRSNVDKYLRQLCSKICMHWSYSRALKWVYGARWFLRILRAESQLWSPTAPWWKVQARMRFRSGTMPFASFSLLDVILFIKY